MGCPTDGYGQTYTRDRFIARAAATAADHGARRPGRAFRPRRPPRHRGWRHRRRGADPPGHRAGAMRTDDKTVLSTVVVVVALVACFALIITALVLELP